MRGMLFLSRSALTGGALLVLAALARGAAGKQLIAHRGASGYAPEHTEAAYRLALEQKADFVEPDLAITRDGILICLHDDTLERTTNVAEGFPDRATTEAIGGAPRRHLGANEITLPEN